MNVSLPVMDKIECLTEGTLEYRAKILDEELLSSPAVLAQRVESELAKRMVESGIWVKI